MLIVKHPRGLSPAWRRIITKARPGSSKDTFWFSCTWDNWKMLFYLDWEQSNIFPVCWCWPLNWKTTKSVHSTNVSVTDPLATHGLEAGCYKAANSSWGCMLKRNPVGKLLLWKHCSVTRFHLFYRKIGAQASKSDQWKSKNPAFPVFPFLLLFEASTFLRRHPLQHTVHHLAASSDISEYTVHVR